MDMDMDMDMHTWRVNVTSPRDPPQARMLYVLLYFAPTILEDEYHTMREIVDRHFAGAWCMHSHHGHAAFTPRQTRDCRPPLCRRGSDRRVLPPRATATRGRHVTCRRHLGVTAV